MVPSRLLFSALILLMTLPNFADAPITQCLVLPPVTHGGRSLVHTDPVEAQIVAGTFAAPKAGDTVAMSDGKKQTWQSLTIGKDGAFHSELLQGGYACLTVTEAAPRVALMTAMGHGMAYVNGEPQPGDPYGYGYVRVPVALHTGVNTLLFACRGDTLSVKLDTPVTSVLLNTADMTLPDLTPYWPKNTPFVGAVVVVNATDKPMAGLTLTAGDKETKLPDLPPLTVRKVGFALPNRTPKGAATELSVPLRLAQGGKTLDAAKITLRVRKVGQTYKRTFVSDIDGSVQYFAVNPPSAPIINPALVLTLHGASVEAIGQADAYESKPWAVLVAPTNRRPYGFDWEDWGRLDALEVLALAKRDWNPDPTHIYLAGHSMGGHGTWQLGALFPGLFAAIGPSAGWISFASYAGGAKPNAVSDPIEAILRRSAATSDTLTLGHNYLSEGVYIIHGGADDNVPVTEARTMSAYLAGFHHDTQYHEQPGAGHWWDVSPEPGADCVDWAPLFDFFAHHTLPSDSSVRQIDFTTVNPGVSAWDHWACVAGQVSPLEPSTVSVRADPGLRRYVGTTQNVSRLGLKLVSLAPGLPLSVELDGGKIEKIPWPVRSDTLWLTKANGTWAVSPIPSALTKNPLRSGPFKDAFRHRFLLVYGTRGTDAENTWAASKARYDAETFWYRGNGSVDILSDTQFNPNTDKDRSVILYGNADTNAAWPVLLRDSPIQVHQGSLTVGTHTATGGDLCGLFLRPRPGSDTACVAAVSGTGLAGMRLTDRLPYLSSGTGVPDWVVLSAGMLTQGVSGARGAGFFGNDWSMETGASAWR